MNLTAYALTFLGKPYLWGGKGPVGYDCSGFVEVLLRAGGVDPLGRDTSQKLFDHFKIVGKPYERGFGALAFYGKSPQEISHVAFMLGAQQIIEASGGDSTTTSLERAQQQGAFIKLSTVEYRKDLAMTILPQYPDWVYL